MGQGSRSSKKRQEDKGGPQVNKRMNWEVTVRNLPLHEVAIVVASLGFFCNF